MQACLSSSLKGSGRDAVEAVEAARDLNAETQGWRCTVINDGLLGM